MIARFYFYFPIHFNGLISSKKNGIHKFQNILIIINQYEIARLYHTLGGICLAWLIIIAVYNLRDNINVNLMKQNKCHEHESIQATALVKVWNVVTFLFRSKMRDCNGFYFYDVKSNTKKKKVRSSLYKVLSSLACASSVNVHSLTVVEFRNMIV